MTILLMMAAPFGLMWLVEKVLIIVDGMDGERVINALLMLTVIASVAKIIRWTDKVCRGRR